MIECVSKELKQLNHYIIMDNFIDDDDDPHLKQRVVVKPKNMIKKDTTLHMWAHELYYNNGKNGVVQHIMMKLGCAALTDPKNCVYFENTLMGIIWSNTYVRSEELQDCGQNAQQLWFADLMAMTKEFPEGADKDVRKWYLPNIPGIFHFIYSLMLFLNSYFRKTCYVLVCCKSRWSLHNAHGTDK